MFQNLFIIIIQQCTGICYQYTWTSHIFFLIFKWFLILYIVSLEEILELHLDGTASITPSKNPNTRVSLISTLNYMRFFPFCNIVFTYTDIIITSLCITILLLYYYYLLPYTKVWHILVSNHLVEASWNYFPSSILVADGVHSLCNLSSGISLPRTWGKTDICIQGNLICALPPPP